MIQATTRTIVFRALAGDLRGTKHVVGALEVEDEDAVFTARDLPGFGAPVYPTGRKINLVQASGRAGRSARRWDRPARKSTWH